jgi:hypothetical protein
MGAPDLFRFPPPASPPVLWRRLEPSRFDLSDWVSLRLILRRVGQWPFVLEHLAEITANARSSLSAIVE